MNRPSLAGPVVLGVFAFAAPALAQDTCPCPLPPPPGWRASIGLGFASTSGNTDTQNVNVSFDAIHDPRRKNVFKADGLWIRNTTDGDTSADRSALGVRDEYTITGRAFAFAEVRHQRDRFKELSYLVTPLAGLGYNLVDTGTLRLTVDGAAGGGFEKLFEQGASADGTFKLGQSLSWQISGSAKLTQSAWGLWKFSDTSDSYYHFDIAIASSVTSFLDVKLSLVDDFKNRPASAGLEKNDLAFLANIVLKL